MSVQAPLPPRLLYTVAEVAEMTGYSESFVYQLVARKVLPSVRLGRSIRVPGDGLVRWIGTQIEGQE